MRFQYGVKFPCTAIRASKHCNMESKRAREFPSMQLVCESTKQQVWLQEIYDEQIATDYEYITEMIHW